MLDYKTPRINDYDGNLTRRWYIQYAFKDPDTGKFVEFREWVSTKHKTKTARYVAAKELRDTWQKKLENGHNPFSDKAEQINVVEALDQIIALKKATGRKRTGYSYYSINNLFCLWLQKKGFDKLAPARINSKIVQNYFDDLILKEKVSPRTHNNHLQALRHLFKILVKRNFMEYNVFSKVDFLAETEVALCAYTIEEKKQIRLHLETRFPELWLAAMFVYYGFVRPQELCRLKLKDIGFATRTIFISGENAKNHKTGTILLPDPLLNLLLRMGYDQLDKELFIFSNGRKLIPGQKEIAPNRIFGCWKEHVKDALKIDKGIYLFKHTGAGELFDDLANPRNIQLQLRHSSLEETLTYLMKYSNRPNESLRAHFKEI